MSEVSRKRAYRSPRRQAQAWQTRAAVLAAARELFSERGYTATTVAAVAERAGVALDTVYATVGRKPEVFRLLVETAVSGTEQPQRAKDAGYVDLIRASDDPRRKLTLYAGAVRQISERVAPLTVALGTAAGQDPDLDRLHAEIDALRLSNTAKFAGHLVRHGGLRRELGVDEVTDVLWLLNSAEVYLSLVRDRGWTPDRYQDWLADSWARLFLAPTTSRSRRKA